MAEQRWSLQSARHLVQGQQADCRCLWRCRENGRRGLCGRRSCCRKIGRSDLSRRGSICRRLELKYQIRIGSLTFELACLRRLCNGGSQHTTKLSLFIITSGASWSARHDFDKQHTFFYFLSCETHDSMLCKPKPRKQTPDCIYGRCEALN